MSVTILCGMPAEAKVISSVFPDLLVLSGAAKLKLPSIVPADCSTIVSVGLCGGLAAGLPVGAVAAASTVVDRAGAIQRCDLKWTSAVVDAGADAGLKLGPVPWYSSGLMDEANSAEQRKAIFLKFGAKAIDDESRYAGALAKQRGIRLGVLRSVSDDFTETLPLAATGPIMNADGSADLDYLLRSIATEPIYQTVDLGKVGLDYAKSLATLERALKVVREAFLSQA